LNELSGRDGFLKERSRVQALLGNSRLQTALSTLDTSPMPIHWRLFFAAVRSGSGLLTYLGLRAMNLARRAV